ncbi:MAG: hypothetical protein JWN02_590 [Acidobacteria bacterium]|nr:hypothetical protein [Acidobacteriota bacterium]
MPHYEISWRDPDERLYDVVISFSAPVDQPRLSLPAWRPGRYVIQNFAANVREWSPNMKKEGKSVWLVDARKGEEVRASYRFYAGTLDAGSCLLEREEAYVNGSNLFMCVEGLRREPALLTIHAPDDWQIEIQLPAIAPRTFRARDFDHLIDSPVIASPRMTRHSFEESGATVHMIFRGDEGIATGQYLEPLRSIVREQAALFGGLPFEEYRFLYHVGDRWHGVEHEDSCSIIVRRGALLGARPGDEGFDHLLSISAHELFHVWNVKRIVPKVFAPYDYSTETPTALLWAMEGITSYFGDLSLARAGVWDTQHYLQHLAREIETLESAPARLHLSLAQASHDGWLHDPSQMHDRANAWISFYNKGELVALLLDLTLRTRYGKSLDEVMRLLWAEYGLAGCPLDEDGIERAVARIAGADLADFFARYVEGVEPLPYAELLEPMGIAFQTRPRPLSLGAKLKQHDGLLMIDGVTRGGTAMSAGLAQGDELVAVAGNRTRSEQEVQRAFRPFLEGEEIDLTVARGGVVRTLRGNVRSDGSVDVTLRVTEADNPLLRQWLRRSE